MLGTGKDDMNEAKLFGQMGLEIQNLQILKR
jgi:hypothetical protein